MTLAQGVRPQWLPLQAALHQVRELPPQLLDALRRAQEILPAANGDGR